jgi:hypothetical protein
MNLKFIHIEKLVVIFLINIHDILIIIELLDSIFKLGEFFNIFVK